MQLTPAQGQSWAPAADRKSMAHPTRIQGTVTLSDGREVQFSIGPDLGWQQWGATAPTCGETVDLMEALAAAAGESGLRDEDEDA